MQRAFSLVELAIVLVILGLLTGGILAGQSLIKAAELRKFISFQTDMQMKVNTFKDKYLAYPGDMSNASSFWPGAGNGNGNGHVFWNVPAENYYFPHHLFLAGLENNFLVDGSAYGGSPYYRTPGIGGNSISYVGSQNTAYGDLYASAPPLGTTMVVNALQTASIVSPVASGPAVIPEDAWNIDTKLDDGQPTSGNMRAANGINVGLGSYAQCLTGSGPYTYNLALTSIACRVMIGIP